MSCPLDHPQDWCTDCRFAKQGLCDHPFDHGQLLASLRLAQLKKAEDLERRSKRRGPYDYID